MDFITQLKFFFTNMTAAVAVCLVIGVIFICVEIFQPGFGVFGTIGVLLVVFGAILRAFLMPIEGEQPYAQIFIAIFIVAIVVCIAYIIMIKMSKMSWLRRTPFIEEATAVGTDFSEGTPDFKPLQEKIGLAVTDLRPVGKANIDGKIYDVIAEGFYVKKGEGIQVISIEGVKILVKKVI